jgi:hypothetical protein
MHYIPCHWHGMTCITFKYMVLHALHTITYYNMHYVLLHTITCITYDYNVSSPGWPLLGNSTLSMCHRSARGIQGPWPRAHGFGQVNSGTWLEAAQWLANQSAAAGGTPRKGPNVLWLGWAGSVMLPSAERTCPGTGYHTVRMKLAICQDVGSYSYKMHVTCTLMM